MKTFLLIALASFFANESLVAQTVVFTKADSVDWTLPENQDRIADSVWITRKHNQSLFNIAQESGYSGSNGSPINTLWADTSTLHAESEQYTSFVSMHGGDTQALINDTVSLYLTEYDQYYDVVFLSYSAGNSGGGFSYSRERANSLNNESEILIPDQVVLHNNYPNPFNPITHLSYELPQEGLVRLTIYDTLGKEVRTLVHAAQGPGHRSISWDATNDQGKPVSAGIYFYQLQVEEYIRTNKMVLLQ